MKSEDENEDGEEKKAHDGGISTHYILLPPPLGSIINIPDTSSS